MACRPTHFKPGLKGFIVIASQITPTARTQAMRMRQVPKAYTASPTPCISNAFFCNWAYYVACSCMNPKLTDNDLLTPYETL